MPPLFFDANGKAITSDELLIELLLLLQTAVPAASSCAQVEEEPGTTVPVATQRKHGKRFQFKVDKVTNARRRDAIRHFCERAARLCGAARGVADKPVPD